MSKTIRKVGIVQRDSNGRLKKGSVINTKGNNQFTSLVPLLDALRKMGKERDEPFWDMVAKRTYTNDTVLIAVLKKILPEKLALSGGIEIKRIEVEFSN